MKTGILNFKNSDKCNKLFLDFYGSGENIIEKQKKRYLNLINEYIKLFRSDLFSIFSTPGRIEICGNHTDHNQGKVIAASISLDSIAAGYASHNDIISVYSSYYDKLYEINVKKTSRKNLHAGTTESLILGMVDGIKKAGYMTGGFNAYIDSDVLPGSGLSSSASFEILIGTIINGLFNNNRISPLELSKAGKYSENEFMHKPSGLMDQTACAFGGIITIDFKDDKKPLIKKINFNVSDFDFSLIIVDTKGNHENLTPYYSSIPLEMKSVAGYFRKQVCRQINLDELTRNIKSIRIKTGDRAVLRAIHYLHENERVDKLINALKNKNFNLFLDLINQSGNSSWKYLQNCYIPENPREQNLSIGLALTEIFISKIQTGACRVHGGGFEGTILAFIPNKHIKDYIKMMENVFGIDSVKKLEIRYNGSMIIF